MAKPDEIDEDLAGALKAAKTRRMQFAFVLKGAEGKLLVSKIKIPPGDIADAKKSSGGTQVFKGACFGEDGKHIFELAKEPPATLAKAIKTVAKRDAGLMIQPVCRIGTDPDLLDDDGAGKTEKPTATTPTTKPTVETPVENQDETAGEDPAAIWNERFSGLTVPMKQVKDIDPTAFEAIRAIALQAQSLAKGGDYAAAHQKLDEADALITEAKRKARTDEASKSIMVGKVEFAKSLLRWEKAINDSSAEVSRLQGLIGSKFPTEQESADELSGVLDEFKTGLNEVLKDGINAADDEARKPLHAEAAGVIRDFQEKARNNELIQIIDDCPFASMKVGEILTKALTDIRTNLKA